MQNKPICAYIGQNWGSRGDCVSDFSLFLTFMPRIDSLCFKYAYILLSLPDTPGHASAVHSDAFCLFLVHWGLDKPLLKIQGGHII